MLNPKYRLKYQAEQAYWENLNENLLEFSSALEFSSNRFDSSRYDFKGISQFLQTRLNQINLFSGSGTIILESTSSCNEPTVKSRNNLNVLYNHLYALVKRLKHLYTLVKRQKLSSVESEKKEIIAEMQAINDMIIRSLKRNKGRIKHISRLLSITKSRKKVNSFSSFLRKQNKLCSNGDDYLLVSISKDRSVLSCNLCLMLINNKSNEQIFKRAYC